MSNHQNSNTPGTQLQCLCSELTDAERARLRQMIRNNRAEARTLESGIMGAPIEAAAQRAQDLAGRAIGLWVKMSPRQRQAARLIGAGLRNKAIAAAMRITEGTVKVYLSRLYDATGLQDRYEVAIVAREVQRIEAEQPPEPAAA